MDGDHKKSLKIAISEFYKLNIDKGRGYTINHFKNEGIPRRTMLNWLVKIDKTRTSDRKAGSGGHNRKLTQPTKKQRSIWQMKMD